jgi:hypothetical protein
MHGIWMYAKLGDWEHLRQTKSCPEEARLCDLPAEWSRQRQSLGLNAA